MLYKLLSKEKHLKRRRSQQKGLLWLLKALSYKLSPMGKEVLTERIDRRRRISRDIEEEGEQSIHHVLIVKRLIIVKIIVGKDQEFNVGVVNSLDTLRGSVQLINTNNLKHNQLKSMKVLRIKKRSCSLLLLLKNV